MKIKLALLFMFSLGIHGQLLIEITEGDSLGQVTNFTCQAGGNFTTFGIDRSYFTVIQTDLTTIVNLTKTIDLMNGFDFPATSDKECLKQVDLSNIRIELKCPGSDFFENRTLIITPKKDHDPYICNTSCQNFSNPLQLKIPENTTANSEIIKFKLCSKDVNVQPSSYGITITGILGERNKDTIYLREEQNYEIQPHKCTSQVSINNKLVLNISISILDSDDLGITFTETFYECQVPETAKKGFMANCDVEAEDMDKGINAPVNYSIISVIPTTGSFMIFQNGSLVLQQPLDRENTSLYNINIKGYQVDRPNDRVNYTTLQVRVTDVDDNLPVVSVGNCSRTFVYENSPIGTIVCQLSYTDKDEGVNAENEFHIKGSENKFLEVEKKTGFIKVKSLIDRESAEITRSNPITFKVYAAPVGDAQSKRSNMFSVNVTVLDENDNSPRFSQENRTININKTQTLNVRLAQVHAIDPDENENGKVNYTLLNSNVPFHLDPNSGNLTLTKSLNESFIPIYQLTIRAVDQCLDVNNRRSSVMLLKVKVADVNIHKPYFFPNMSKTINVPEDAQIGTIIMEIKAGDIDPTDLLTFSLQGDNEKFALENKLLKTKDGLDREKKDNYTLTVSVNDSKHVTKTSVNIIVTDVNDNSPNFGQKKYTFNVTEEESNVTVGVVQANDIDFGDNGKVEYYIDKNSPWYSNFTLKVKVKTCEIRTNGKIDREEIENGRYIQFFVFAKDHGSPQRINSSSIKITVIDINDHVPQFVTTLPNTFNIKEDTLNLSNVFKVSAVDPDNGRNALVSYTIRKGTKAAGLFEINSASGFISLKSSPKIEACNDSVRVITVETYNPLQNGTYNVLNITCNIEDVNNHSPVFNYKYNTTEINESNLLTTGDIKLCFDGSKVHFHGTTCNLQAASDADCIKSYSKLVYWMDSNDDRFKINSSTGIISIKKGSSLDFDTLPYRNKVHFTVHATDGLYTTNKTLIFNIINRQDSLPEFSKETFKCSVDECPEKNLRCSLTLRNENDTLPEIMFNYSLSKGGDNTNFVLRRSSQTAEIGLTKCYDFEKISNNTFMLEVQVHDRNNYPKTSCKVIITINNINDNPPVFGNSTYKFSILETYRAGYMLGIISASDADNLGNITYDLKKNDYLTYTGGILKLKKVPDLDNGKLKSPINGKVYAFDGTHNVSTVIEITVTAVNEYPPEFRQKVYNVTVKENAKFNLTVQALDSDAGKDGTIARYVIPEKWNKNITLKNDTLEILGLDRDIMGTSSMLQFTIKAVDGGTPPRTGEATVNILVEGVNDNIPKFPTDERTVYIYRPEGATKGVLFTAKAIDKDIGTGSKILYRLNSTYHLFQIDQTSGVINCTEDLFIDMANNGHFNVVVEAFNEGSEDFDSLTIILKLTYSNNHSPVFDNCTTSFDLIETNETEVIVGVLSAHDEDKGRNGLITFSLLDDNENSPFQVSNRTKGTCVVKTVRPVDREKQDTYNLVVKATDNGIINRTSFCKLQVHILDVNDNYPKFDESSTFYGRVKENSMLSTVIHPPTIIVTDPDKGDNGTAGLFFKLSDNSSPFCIKKTNHSFYMNVTIFVCGTIDREEKAIYHLSIIAKDLNGSSESLSATASLTIEIIGENDETPQFNDTHYEYNITENAFTSQIVGHVAAFDRDEEDVIIYSIVSGDYGRFYINQSGCIFVSGEIDRENMSSYTLNVSVSDGVHKNFTSVKITIIDKNDNPPKFLMYTYEEAVDVEIEENAQPGIIFNATATDQDEIGSDNSKVVYSLDVNQRGDGLNMFNITDDGILYLTGRLDRETEEYYEVNVTATDMGKPPLSTSVSVHVKVLDVNDNRPEICVDGQCNVSSSNCYTIEKVPKYSVLKLVGSKDNDKGENATVLFSIESSDISKYFRIDNITGVVSVAEPLIVNNLIHEGLEENNGTVVVNLTIVATDGGGLNTSLALHVFVEPINDDDVPVFSETVFRFNISETTITGVIVGNCSAKSNDVNSHMTYELISGYGRDLPTFEIDANTGNIKTKAPLDRETIDKYTLAVQVRDGRVPERTAFASVEITVDDINDNSPTFSNDNVTLFVNENAEVYIHKNISASDNDVGLNAEITYTLNVTIDATNNDYDGSINISENGILTVTGKFDYEQQTQYDIVVMATDKGNNPLSSTAQVHIVVLDKNDNSPKFHNDKHIFNISEDKTSSKIFTANATDEDSGLNGQIVYKLLDTEDIPFVIDPFSGTVSLQGRLDYETRKNYILCVIAEDFGSPRRMSTFNATIYIKDVYDDELFFLKDTFDVFISRESKINSSLLNLTISVKEANFSLKGRDSEYFSVGKMSGEIFLKKAFDSERDVYMIQAFAEDIIGQNASAMVFVYVTGHQVKFDKPEIKLHLQENINGASILVDLNTTEEFAKTGVEYNIVEVKPPAGSLFEVNKTTGVVTCTRALNREETAQYTILISAKTPETRKRREIQKPSSVISLIVDVDDVNDNPPFFPSDQEKVFGVPDNARGNYLVGTIRAEDPDISDVGLMKYMTIGGRTDVFGIDEDTGDIFTLVAISSTRAYKFNLSISASDGYGMQDETEVNITIHVVPTKNQPILLVNMTVAEFKKKESEYRRNMSEILGVSIQFEKIALHQITDSYGRTKLDLSRTDLIFHGINETTGMLVSNSKMKLLIKANIERLSSLFGQKFDVRVASVDTIADPSAITASQILFICMAVFIFFGSLSALVVSQYSWMRYETERQEVEKRTKPINNELEMSQIRSRRSRKRRSSKRSSITAAAATNPAYAETELITSSPLSPELKSKPQYESQELRVEFNEELPETGPSDFNIRGDAQRVFGSGEENIHTDDSISLDLGQENRENQRIVLVETDQLFATGDGPIMESSPRPSRDTRQVGNGPTSDLPGNNSQSSDIKEGDESTRARGGSILLLDATGEGETDDIEKESDTNDSEGGSDKFPIYPSFSEEQTSNLEKESEPTDETSAAEAEMLGDTSSSEDKVEVKEAMCDVVESFQDETDSVIESTSF